MYKTLLPWFYIGWPEFSPIHPPGDIFMFFREMKHSTVFMYGNIEMLIAFLFSVRSHIYSYMKEVWAYIFEEVEYYFFKAIRSIIALVAVPTMFVIFFFIVAPAVAMYVKSQEILPRKYRTHIEQK